MSNPRKYLAPVLFLALVSCSQLDPGSLGRIMHTGDAPLDEQTAVAGLREALKVGTRRAVDATSAPDGFLGNALIRITIPDEYQKVAGTLRDIGWGKQVDRLEVAMNRAAERAAGEAVDVFWDAITRMTVADAFSILHGNDTAATDYFQSRTRPELESRFRPIVAEKMEEVGLYALYRELSDRYNALPFVTEPAIDLEAYTTAEALDGLFAVLGQEEKRIREDPLARTTDLLRRVFGTRNQQR
jgi:hypothetical protein